ncbi:MAG: phosphoadenosine phosphosulfate reductase family protein [Marinifilum sp.]|nr:phosphoadenosine phosphosulfate reductase family protein [Marinifilum sp.]
MILFYSGGKDSLVLLDLLSPLFKEVHCVFMYFVEGLEHQNPILVYPKRYPNVTIHQYPHWMVSHYYRRSYYRFHRVDENIPTLSLGDIEEKARRDTGCKWVVNGAKQSDGLNRNLMLGTLKFNSINDKSHRTYPLAMWKKADVLAYMRHHRLSKPVEYTMNKSNGIDLKLDVLLFLREQFPEDYHKILKHFPFAEKLIFEHDFKEKQDAKAAKFK